MRAATSRGLAALCTIALAAQSATGQRASPTLDDVARALGGKDRILGVRTLVLEGGGSNYNLGQNLTPFADLPVFEVAEFRRQVDFAQRRLRQEQLRTPRFPAGNPTPQRQRIAVDGDVAFDILPDGSARRASSLAAVDRANELLHHPIGFLQAAFAAGTEITEDQPRGGNRWVRMNVGGNKFAMLVNPRTKLPVRTQKYVYHPVLGDALLETEFADWQEVDGLQLPMRIGQRLDGRWPLSDIRLTSVRVNTDVGDLAAPADVRSAAVPVPTINVSVEELSPGVWYLTGQTHHSVAIEMQREVLLVEAPQSDARTLAVIARARELRPGKPVRTVINTHHHFDHSGGVRAAMAEGLSVVTHAANKTFFDTLGRRRHFIEQDALARARKAPRVEAVRDKRVFRDAARTVEVNAVRGSPHSGSILMVYLPAERMLIEADLYSPPAPGAPPAPAPFVAELIQNVDRLGLDVDRVVPIHGRVVTMADVRDAARAARAGDAGRQP